MPDGPLTLLFPQTYTPPAPGPESWRTDFQLVIAGVDVTGLGEWDFTWEERADGTPGQATGTVQDRTTIGPTIEYGRKRDRVQAFLSGAPIFDGEITTSQFDLSPGVSWRRWKFTATDWNTVFDLRLVGEQLSWISYDGGMTYQEVDTYANSSGPSDASIVRTLVGRYAALPNGQTFDVSPYVYQYMTETQVLDPTTGIGHLNWSNSNSTLKSALNELKSLGMVIISCWIDPSLKVHWVNLGDSNCPAAPARVADTGVNGTTIIGGRALTIQYDGTYMPQAVFVSGTVPDVLPTIETSPGVWAPEAVKYGGTNWAWLDSSTNLRQINVDAQTANPTQRDAVGAAYTVYGQRARIRGSVTVSGRLDEKVDGFHAGQMLTVTDARLPATMNGQAFPIQRVKGILVKGQNVRRYDLGFGDAPPQSFSAKWRQQATQITLPNMPAYTWQITYSNVSPLPGVTQTLRFQALDTASKPVRASGLACNLTLQSSSDGITWVTATDGSLGSTSLVSNQDGQCTTTFTMGAGALQYRVSADTPIA